MGDQEIENLFGSIAEAEKRRAEQMPTEQHCLRAMFDAYLRLKELGWNDMIYAPKDGQVVDSISVGSTGIHPANYLGEWPEGRWWVHDGGDLWPSTPAMYRKTPAELTRWAKLSRKFRDAAMPDARPTPDRGRG